MKLEGKLATINAAQTAATPSQREDFNTPLQRARDLRHAQAEPATATTHKTKLLATGNAIRWHGYEARLGLGTTRTRNHINENKPNPEKIAEAMRFLK